MRILSLSAQRPDSTGSGVYLSELVSGFARLGHEQAVVAADPGGEGSPFGGAARFYPVRYSTPELPYPTLGMSDQMPYESTRYRDMTDGMTERFRAVFGKTVLRAAEELRPDAVICHHLYYLAALTRELRPELPLYAVCHGTDLRQLRKNPWERDYIIKTLSGLDGALALHGPQKREIEELFGLPGEKVHVVGSGYNGELFRPGGERPRGGKRRLIYAGKICEKKGLLSLMRASALLREPEKWRIELAGGVGEAGEWERISAAAAASPCECVMPGKLPQAELAGEMRRSDVFVLPSFFEGLPLVLIEALACGARCVCTDLPGIREWLDERVPGNGVVFVKPPLLVNDDEPAEETLPEFERALAEGIEAALDAPPAPRELVEALSWDGLCGRIERIIEGQKA